jgi:hypothetical protein
MERSKAILIFMIPPHLAQEMVQLKIAELHKQANSRRPPKKRARISSLARLMPRLKTHSPRRPVAVAEAKCAL